MHNRYWRWKSWYWTIWAFSYRLPPQNLFLGESIFTNILTSLSTLDFILAACPWIFLMNQLPVSGYRRFLRAAQVSYKVLLLQLSLYVSSLIAALFSNFYLEKSCFCECDNSGLQVPVVDLEFLSNYLAELTLIDYEFLKFRPSLIAASAVFLARWTLNQSSHPWVCIFLCPSYFYLFYFTHFEC